jgi:hypothetical protein
MIRVIATRFFLIKVFWMIRFLNITGFLMLLMILLAGCKQESDYLN